MQTNINAAGLRLFDGDIDRFAIFSLVIRESMRGNGRGSGISTHSMAISLSRSFETVRRHVNALIAAGFCARVRGGVIVHPDMFTRADVQAIMALSHDCFVRLVEGLERLGEPLPPGAPGRSYDPVCGIEAAIDVMLCTVDSNRSVHRSWLDLVLFSTILCGNLQRAGPLGAPISRFTGAQAVRASVLSRVLNLSETTVRRRLTRLTVVDGPVVRLRQGFVVSERWLATQEAQDTSRQTYAGIRLVLTNAAARGFPFQGVSSAYLGNVPPVPVFL